MLLRNARENMRITTKQYEEIMKMVNPIPPESGGILGSRDDMIVATFYDKGIKTEKMCSYIPNVNLLNDIIAKWNEENIVFSGIFHTHYFGVRTLSCGDRNYIEKIMMSMPNEVSELYFPIIVMPQKEMIVYKAIKSENQILIQEDVVCLERR